MTEDINSKSIDLSELELLQRSSSEAVIYANTDPSKLTQEEHRRVRLLQSMASCAVMEANLRVLANKPVIEDDRM